jgi:predicted ATP-grasp superfamily ATP-dependent carboligase
MSPDEFDALLREAEAFQEKLRRIVEEREAAAKAREERRLRRRRFLGLLPL